MSDRKRLVKRRLDVSKERSEHRIFLKKPARTARKEAPTARDGRGGIEMDRVIPSVTIRLNIN